MNLKNKTVLVTGSTDGVGRLVARRLADQGARVLIHGRDRTRGEQLLEEIRAAGRGSAVFLPADFSSLAEVRRLADTVRQECDRLDVLINNAGIGSGGSAGKRETSQDGYELRFAVNYLAGFLLTRILLPIVMRGKPARIVNVSSLGQHPIALAHLHMPFGRDLAELLVPHRFPLRSCSRSIASNRALKLPSPKPRAPCRSMISKNTVGRSPTGLVKICSR